MRQTVKSITFRIFLIVLVSGIVGIGGVLLLKYDLDILSADYKRFMNVNYENMEYMGSISKMIYQHQAVVANHIRSDESSEKSAYELEEAEIRQKLRHEVVQFGERMTEGEEEILYHKVYSNTLSYLKNVDVVFAMSWVGDQESANFYISNNMNDQINNVNDSIQELERLTDASLKEAKSKMDAKIDFYRISAAACILVIIVVMGMCVVNCVRLTAQMEKYKISLEKEVQRKSREIIQNNSKILQIQNNTVFGMANLIESRDGESGEHVKRTSAYVEILANEALDRGLYADILSEEYIELLVRSAPMHDVGKIVVPDYILKKPGKLTDEEFDVMKNHAREGERIVHSVLAGIENNEYLQIASDVAAYHHEKWNGKGYPYGLAGEEIPLSARIMAIADVFDALVSVRCYKKAMTMDEAMAIIEKDAGSHFDPVLAKIFLDLREIVETIVD